MDLTATYVRAAAMLTGRLGLADRVTHRIGDALALPFDDASFDVVWTQNSGMNVADKGRLYAGFHRVLRPGGSLAVQVPMAGPIQPPIFPLMWARDAGSSLLSTPQEMLPLIEAAGFAAVPATNQAYGDIRPSAHRDNDYLCDWEVHRTRKFFGVPGVGAQDKAITESQQPILDRTRERLGKSDSGIIRIRKYLADAVVALRDRRTPPPGMTAASHLIRGASVLLPKDVPWVEGAKAQLAGQTGGR